MEERKIQLRHFAFSFGITLLLFTLAAAVAVFLVTPPVNNFQSKTKGQGTNHYLPEQSEALTILVAVGENAPHTFLLIGFEPFKGSIPVLAIAPNTVFSTSEQSLGEVYATGGIAASKQAVANYFGIAVERTASFSDKEFADLLNSFGTTETVLLQDIAFVQAGTRVNLAQGVHRLSGEEVVAAMSAQYKGGQSQRTQGVQQIICDAINEHLPMAAQYDDDTFYRQITAYGTSDLTYGDIAGRMQAIRFLVKLKYNIAVPATQTDLLPTPENKLSYSQKAISPLKELYHEQS